MALRIIISFRMQVVRAGIASDLKWIGDNDRQADRARCFDKVALVAFRGFDDDPLDHIRLQCLSETLGYGPSLMHF